MENVKQIISAGILVDPDAVESINELPEHSIQFILDVRPESLTKKSLTGLLQPKSNITEFGIWKEISVGEYTRLYNERFSFLQKILLSKNINNPISLSSIGEIASDKFSVICMVKSIDGNKIMAEDKTGKAELVLVKDLDAVRPICLDDVLGFSITKPNKITDIIYPDIPMSEGKQPKHPVNILIVRNTIPAGIGYNYLINFSELNAPQEVLFNGCCVLVFNTDKRLTQIIDHLKKRNTNTPPNDLIKHITDYVVFPSKEPVDGKYKSTRLIGVVDFGVLDLMAGTLKRI